MKIVISGYGKMGREIEQLLTERHVECSGKSESIMTFDRQVAAESVCIDFTTPEAFLNNYRFIADNFKAAVIGTTGWNEQKEEVVKYFSQKNKTLIYSSNFSIGVNIFFKITEITSKLIGDYYEYQPYILEMHHNKKLDAPSGTAKKLASIVNSSTGQQINIKSIRCGNIPGIHQLGFEGPHDRIVLKHEAFSRRGFAEGAVMAALWSEQITGIYEFRELLEDKFNKTIWNE
jgi:4-hydroxy-tetrahydrodipicolinate reductase